MHSVIQKLVTLYLPFETHQLTIGKHNYILIEYRTSTNLFFSQIQLEFLESQHNQDHFQFSSSQFYYI
jgi:hypothetical protein